jgi:hypothetical protein
MAGVMLAGGLNTLAITGAREHTLGDVTIAVGWFVAVRA